MTYRERREAKLERLGDWAEKRDARAQADYEASRQATAHIPFGQPILVGHHSEKGHRADLKRSERAMDRMCDSMSMASRHREKAHNIKRQLRTSIYSDDADAIERLEAKLSKLEAAREQIKARNAEFRQEHKAKLKGLSAYERSEALPHAPYELRNLGGRISQGRKRLKQLKQAKASEQADEITRTISARRDGDCAWCFERITAGESISKVERTWGHTHCAQS